MAYQIGRSRNIFKNNLIILETLFSKINIDPGFSIDTQQLKVILEDISLKLPDKAIESSYYIDNNNLIITKGSTGNAIKIEETANYIEKNINNLNLKNNYIELFTEEQHPNEINIDSIYNEIYKEPKDAFYTQDPFVITPSENGIDFAISLDEAKQLLQKKKKNI